MKISYNWLKAYVDMTGATPHGVPTPEEYAKRLDECGIDVEGISHLYAKDGKVTEDDTIIDVRISKELSDYSGMMWVANETCGLFNIPIDDCQSYSHLLPDDRWVRDESDESSLYVNSTTKKCKMIVARAMNVKAGKSPDFIRNALYANGIEPTINLKDIPLFSARNIGQPMFGIDYDKFKTGKIIAELSPIDGTIVCEGKEYAYKAGDLVLTNGEKVFSVAGVVTDDSVAVDENTTKIIVYTVNIDRNIVSAKSVEYGRYDLNTVLASLGCNHASAMKEIGDVTSWLYMYADACNIEAMDIYYKFDFTKSIMETRVEVINHMLSTNYTYKDILSHVINAKVSAFVKEPVYFEGKQVVVDVCEPSPYVQDFIRFGCKLGSYRDRREPCDLAQIVISLMGCDNIQSL